jgi:hypothetical protein
MVRAALVVTRHRYPAIGRPCGFRKRWKSTITVMTGTI